MQYIGMDTHISNLDFAVVNDDGRLVKSTSVLLSFIQVGDVIEHKQLVDTVSVSNYS